MKVVAQESELGRWLSRILPVVIHHRILLLTAPLVIGILTALASLMLSNSYLAETTILPPQQQKDLTAMLMGQVGGLGGFAANAAGLSLKDPNDYYIGLLKSRSVADSVIRRNRLAQHYDAKLRRDQRKMLAKRTKIVAKKDGTISISVEDQDSVLCAAIAASYVHALQSILQHQKELDASRRRQFFDARLMEAKSHMTQIEDSLNLFLKKNNLVSVEAAGMVGVQEAAGLRAELSSREVMLGAMQNSFAQESQQVQQIRAEISSLRARLKAVNSGSLDGSLGNGALPDVGMQYMRLFREQKYQEALFEILAKQYEIARLEEANNTSVIQILDPAEIPERKNRPSRARLVLEMMILTTVFVSAAVVARSRRII